MKTLKFLKGLIVVLTIFALTLCAFRLLGYVILDPMRVDKYAMTLFIVLIIQISILVVFYGTVKNGFLKKVVELNDEIVEQRNINHEGRMTLQAVKNLAMKHIGITQEAVDEEVDKLMK